MFACESSSKKLQIKISFIYILLIWSLALVSLPFLNIVASSVSSCSIEKVKFENIIFNATSRIAIAPAGVAVPENRLLKFDILILLGDNYGVTIYKNSGTTTATPFNNKISVEIVDRVSFQMAFTIDNIRVYYLCFYRQACNRYTSK